MDVMAPLTPSVHTCSGSSISAQAVWMGASDTIIDLNATFEVPKIDDMPLDGAKVGIELSLMKYYLSLAITR